MFRAQVLGRRPAPSPHPHRARISWNATAGADGLVLVGLYTRGLAIAHRLADAIARFEDVTVPVGALDVAFYRDDIALRPTSAAAGARPRSRWTSPAPPSCSSTTCSSPAAPSAPVRRAHRARPAPAVQVAVLADRGHRELPIRADYVGKNLPTKRAEDVRVRLHEVDGGDDGIELWAPADPAGPDEEGT